MKPESVVARVAAVLGECEEKPLGQEASARIGIVFDWPNLDSVPSLCNAAELLAAQGYKVEFFTNTASGYIAPSFKSRLVEIVLPKPRRGRTGIHRYMLARWSYPTQVWQRHVAKPYQCFIGVDPVGLIRAHSLAALVKVPVAYYSLELLFSDELRSAEDRQLKEQEVVLSQKAPFVIIQDEERAQLLAQENQIPLSRFLLVPNSPVGPARRRRSRHWHECFGLSRETRIVLHAGSVCPFTGIEEIVRSVGSWPGGWVLVVHSYYDAESQPHLKRLRESSVPGRVFFSLKPVSRHEYDSLVDGAEIGLAFYRPNPGSTLTQRNIQAIGLSSGKIAHYLRSGLPVIVNREASVGSLLEAEGCGVRVDEAGGIAGAIERIDHDYQEYSQRARRVFDSCLDFERAFGEVIARIGALEA